VISALRRTIAVVVALLVTLVTLGRVTVSWTGKRGGLQHDHRGGPAATRVVADEARRPRS
jgi:hypothetical protein